LFVCFEIKGGLANGPRKLHKKKGNCVQSDLKPACEVTPILYLEERRIGHENMIFILGQLE
jgi:hypothetical protein